MAVEFIVMIFTSDQTICSKPCIFKRLRVNCKQKPQPAPELKLYTEGMSFRGSFIVEK